MLRPWLTWECLADATQSLRPEHGLGSTALPSEGPLTGQDVSRQDRIGSLALFPPLNEGRSSISISQAPFSFSIAAFPAVPVLFAGIVLFLALVAVGRVTVFECANLCYCPRARRSHGDPTNMTQENVC